jgi:CheY-like chemotaxis protein
VNKQAQCAVAARIGSVAVPKTVLVVDDDPDFRFLVELILGGSAAELAEAGLPDALRVASAATGGEALQHLADHPPDLVILDLTLPDTNGWEVFVAMRRDPRLAHIPVIILSSQGTRHDRVFGLQIARVHDYLTKPCLPSRLRASVAAALHP